MTCHDALVGCFVTTPFSLSNHNCLLFFFKPSFSFLHPLHLGSFGVIFWGEFDNFNKRLILFLLIPMVNGLSDSIL